ncbi:MAG: DUF1028 domain-containing protein [Acidobacteria bacterium]|nr:DUF1028 domain-containing protein [Acidobacteriota bacterium]
MKVLSRRSLLATIVISAFSIGIAQAQDFDPDYMSTFSIIARDPATGELGECVTSKAFAGGNGGFTGKGGVAIIAHQAARNPMYGEVGIQLIEKGMTPQEALAYMQRADTAPESRQVAILDIQGRSTVYTNGGESSGAPGAWRGHHCGVNYCAQGNTLVGPQVIEAVWKTFEASTGPLAERLMAAIDAGQAAGGDSRGKQTAALLIVKPKAGPAGWSDRAIDLRVDDHPEPMVELRRLLNVLRSGQMITEGNQKLNSGDLKGGLDILIAATQKAPGNDNTWVAVANGYLKNNRKADALNALRKAVELNPNNKQRLPGNQNFQSLLQDPEFKRIFGL